MSAHVTVDLEPDEEGWYPAVCQCGQNLGVFPGAEDAADALMDHAYNAGLRDGAGEARS